MLGYAYAKVMLPAGDGPAPELARNVALFAKETGAQQLHPPHAASPGPVAAVLEYRNLHARQVALQQYQKCPGQWGFFVQADESGKPPTPEAQRPTRTSRGRRGCRGGRSSGGSKAEFAESDTDSLTSSPPVTRPVTPAVPEELIPYRAESPPALVMPSVSRSLDPQFDWGTLGSIDEDADAARWEFEHPASPSPSSSPLHFGDPLNRASSAPPDGPLVPIRHTFIHYAEPDVACAPERPRSRSCGELERTQEREEELEDARHTALVGVSRPGTPAVPSEARSRPGTPAVPETPSRGGTPGPLTPPRGSLSSLPVGPAPPEGPTPERVSPRKCHRGSRGRGGKGKKPPAVAAPLLD